MSNDEHTSRRPTLLGAVRAIALVDARRLLRDRMALFSIIVLPVLIIVVIGTTTGSSPRHLPIGVLDLDGSDVAHQLSDRIGSSGGGDVSIYTTRADLERDIRTQIIVAGLVIPSGFGSTAAGGQHAQVDLLVPQSEGGGQAAQAVVQSAADQIGARLAATDFVRREVGANVDAAAAVDRAGAVMHPIAVESRTVGREQLSTVNQFSYTAPSNLVLFVFITSLAGGGALVEARRLGVTRRALGAPIRIGALLLGAGTMRYLTALLQAALILTIGAVVFGVTWGPPSAVVVLLVVYAMVGAGAGMLVGAVARNPEQATAIGIPAAIGMGMLGGCMWPLEVVPAPLRALGHVVPQAWAMDGFVGLIYDGKDLAGIAGDIAALAAYAIVLLSIATVLLRRTLTR